MKQSEVNSIAKLHSYLEYRQNHDGKIYHYTNLSNLIKIIKSGKLFLNNIKNVNDAMEFASAHNDNMYVASFTYQEKEAVHYWSVYGKGDPYSIRLSFDTQSICSNKQCYHSLDGTVVPSLKCSKMSDVIYYNKRPKLSKDKRCWKHNGQYFSLYNDEDSIRQQFPGLCKYDVWEHEKETRLLVISDIDEGGILLDIPQEFFQSVSVVFSPWIEEEIRVEFSELLTSLIQKNHGILKSKNLMRKSSIHNQIRIK